MDKLKERTVTREVARLDAMLTVYARLADAGNPQPMRAMLAGVPKTCAASDASIAGR